MARDEKRAHVRRQVLIPAKVFNLSRSMVVRCAVRNACKGGCMIVTSEALNLPDQIQIEIANFKGSRQGKIVWRDRKTAGVRFF